MHLCNSIYTDKSFLIGINILWHLLTLCATADKAPAALVSLVGRKEYERCAQDVYFFLQVKSFSLEKPAFR